MINLEYVKTLAENELLEITSDNKPTEKQLSFIHDIEEFVEERFTGRTKREASEYIDRNIEMFKLLSSDGWSLKYT